MLTPRGTGARSRAPRRWTKVFAVLVALALAAVAGYGAWWFLSQDEPAPPPSAKPTRTCTTPAISLPKERPEPEGIDLVVANGTSRSGLAVSTADALAARGFAVVEIGNTARPVRAGVAEIRYPRGELGAAVVVASYIPGATLVAGKTDQVALWLGPDFTDVADESDVEGVTLPPGQPECRRQR